MTKASAKKPFKCDIQNWYKVPFDVAKYEELYNESCGLGYVIHGHALGHPEFGSTKRLHTSFVVSHNPETGEIETRNSRYKLIGEENKEE